MAKRRVTSYDVATAAGVSQTTVSFVLNEVAEARISDETRLRVLAAAEELGYVPDAAAQTLGSGRTQIVGVVVTTLADPFIGALVQAIESAAHDQGYVIILASSNNTPQREIAAARMLQSRRVDGVIVASSRVDAVYQGQLQQLSVPLVLINSLVQHSVPYTFSIGVDNRHGGRLATNHLIQKGHRRIAYMASPADRVDDIDRMDGYRDALREAGVGFDPSLIVRGTGCAVGGQQALSVLLSLADPPSGVFCYNDMTAIGVIAAARGAGLSLPRDLAIVGFDDIVFARLAHPPLTTIAQPLAELGQSAVEMVQRLLSEDPDVDMSISHTAIPGRLIVRSSSG
ncbi:MAG TPA: LacI family DNA-binding transcriptional regulator [Anaerolineae bacterium]|nr:LacI family DNA-binding transcriptional regulator [Anaerolineae bacterium]